MSCKWVLGLGAVPGVTQESLCLLLHWVVESLGCGGGLGMFTAELPSSLLYFPPLRPVTSPVYLTLLFGSCFGLPRIPAFM